MTIIKDYDKKDITKDITKTITKVVIKNICVTNILFWTKPLHAKCHEGKNEFHHIQHVMVEKKTRF